MPPSKRRRITEPSESPADEVVRESTANDEAPGTPLQAASQTAVQTEENTNDTASALASDIADKNKERQDRFKALQARAVSSIAGSLSTLGSCHQTPHRTKPDDPMLTRPAEEIRRAQPQRSCRRIPTPRHRPDPPILALPQTSIRVPQAPQSRHHRRRRGFRTQARLGLDD